MSAAENSLHHDTWEPTFKHPDGFPKDYPVPDFGVDHDILSTAEAIKVAEALTKHQWNWKLRPAADYKLDKGVPAF